MVHKTKEEIIKGMIESINLACERFENKIEYGYQASYYEWVQYDEMLNKILSLTEELSDGKHNEEND